MKKAMTISISVTFLCFVIQGNCQWQKFVIDDGMNSAVSVDTADLDGDNKVDLISTEAYGNNLIWYQNDFPIWNKHIIDSNAPLITFAYAGDIDGDDTLDIAAVLWGSDQIVWYENNHPTWTKHIIDGNAGGADFMQVADIDGDDKLDILTAGEKEGDVVWYENNHPDWTRHVIEADMTGVTVLRANDIDGDEIMDVVAAMPNENDVVWYKTEDKGLSWTKNIIDDNLINAFSSNVGDINGDGKEDVVATTGGPYYTGSDVIWYENQHPAWTKYVVDTDLPGGTQTYMMDVDGDDTMDIVATGFHVDDVVWYENNHPVWTKHIIDENLDGPRTGMIFDMDGDNVKDVFLPGKSSVVWYKNPNTKVAYFSALDDYAAYVSMDSGDSVILKAQMTNLDTHPANAYAIIQGEQSEFIDTMQLYDDGLHSDNISDDAWWANKFMTDEIPEDIYNAKLCTFDSVAEIEMVFPVPARFITFGPVALVQPIDPFEIPANSIYTFKITLQNNSSTATATNIQAKLRSSETGIIIPNEYKTFDDIAAGESKESNHSFKIELTADSEVGTQKAIIVDIAFEEKVFWSDTFNIDIIAGVNDFTKDPIVRIYPNPVNDLLTVESSHFDTYSIEMFSLSGQLVYRTMLEGDSKQIDLSALSKGVYFLTLRSKELVWTEKVIKF